MEIDLREQEIKSHISEYQSKRPVYESFSTKLSNLIKELMNANDIKYHLIEYRAKTVDSFEGKIRREGKNYREPISEISDLCGCRIINYYTSDIVLTCDVLKSEFNVIEEVLSHQQNKLDADRFGYLSVHYIIRLGENRKNLPEWRDYACLTAEVQVRTVIQHAWAVISHELQYKQEANIPSGLQRRLFRIAGLFELADEEFIGIRDQRLSIIKSTEEVINDGIKDVPLSASAIVAVIETWNKKYDIPNVAKNAGFIVDLDSDHLDNDSIVQNIYDVATANNINTVDKLFTSLENPNNMLLNEIFKSNCGADSHDAKWIVNTTFLALLILLSKHKNISIKFLVELGWSRNIAVSVVESIKKIKRMSG